MATRAASICRDVMRPHSVACRPKSPKSTESPPLARPAMWPFIDLRNLVLLGESMAGLALAPRWLALRRRARKALGRQDFALEDPALHTDDAVGGASFGEAVFD